MRRRSTKTVSRQPLTTRRIQPTRRVETRRDARVTARAPRDPVSRDLFSTPRRQPTIQAAARSTVLSSAVRSPKVYTPPASVRASHVGASHITTRQRVVMAPQAAKVYKAPTFHQPRVSEAPKALVLAAGKIVHRTLFVKAPRPGPAPNTLRSEVIRREQSKAVLHGPVKPHSVDKSKDEPRERPTCKARPDDSRRSGGGPSRRFIPWCK